MIPRRQPQRLANAQLLRLHQPMEFEDNPSHRAALSDDDDFFGDPGGGADDGVSDRGEFDETYDPIPELSSDVPEASGIPFWPTEEDGTPAVPDRVDVDMFVYRRLFAMDLPRIFGSWALFELGPSFGTHRGVTEGLTDDRRAPGGLSKLYIGKCCGWQVFIERLSVTKRAGLKEVLLQCLNDTENGAGYIKASNKPYTVAGNNVRVTLGVWEQVMMTLEQHRDNDPLDLTLCVYGTKMPLPIATELNRKFNLHRLGTMDFDFAFEVPCPTGFPIFRSRFVKKGGNNSGTTRIFDRLGRAMIGLAEEDFGTVRFVVPNTIHQITFYCKAIQALKVDGTFDAGQMPRTGKTARDRIDAIKISAETVRLHFEADPERWMVARVEVTIKGVSSFSVALRKAKDIMRQQVPRIDVHVVTLESLLEQLEAVELCPAYVGDNTPAISDATKVNIAVLQNKMGFWYKTFAGFLPDYSRVGVGQIAGPLRLAQDEMDEGDEEVNILDYIYDIPPKVGAKVQTGTRHTYMAPNEKNNRVSKKKHYNTVEEAKEALIQAASTREQHWSSYGVPKKGSGSSVFFEKGGVMRKSVTAKVVEKAPPLKKRKQIDTDLRVGKSDDIFHVDRIEDQKIGRDGKVLYNVKWLDPDAPNTWEPRENVSDKCIEEWNQGEFDESSDSGSDSSDIHEGGGPAIPAFAPHDIYTGKRPGFDQFNRRKRPK